MKLFGYELTKVREETKALNTVSTSWWSPLFGSIIHEPYTGAWQQNATPLTQESLLQFSAVYACVTGIASDIAKCRIMLDQNEDGIWTEITEAHGNSKESTVLPVLRKPNHFQNRIKFIEQWIISKLLSGNTYVLKERDRNQNVVHLYILDPSRVTPLVSETGAVFYELKADYLSGVSDIVVVPASEIIHDMTVSLWHPLVGVPPIYACAMSATMGNKIQLNSTKFFANSSRPGGILTAPGKISDDTALRLKTDFETNFGGANIGRISVLGDGLKFEHMAMTAENAQLSEQLKWTVEDVARAFHYPLSKLGVSGAGNQTRNPEADTTMYYVDCLQHHIECLELCLDEGLELPPDRCTELDLDNLLRMDTAALVDSIVKSSPYAKVNEQRRRANLKPIQLGGDEIYRQHQDYSIRALAKRDASEDPFGLNKPAAPAPSTPSAAKGIDSTEATELLLAHPACANVIAHFESELVGAQ